MSNASQALRPLPMPSDLTRPFWEGTRNERLLIQCCMDCGHHQFYPRPFCLQCMSTKVEWKQASGKGSIYTYTVNRRGANAYAAERVPYVVAMIDLDEGVRLMANLIDCRIEDVRIGSRVQVRFERVNEEVTLPQFTLDK
jgi:uncharacterized OB-fold protein